MPRFVFVVRPHPQLGSIDSSLSTFAASFVLSFLALRIMTLTKTVRGIQYQIAKLEVIELLFWHGKNYQPSLDTEMAYNIMFTLRQKLFSDSEACFDAPSDVVQSYIASLQSTIISANNFLVQTNSGLSSTEIQVLFLKKLFTNIISELIALNTELSVALQRLQISSTYRNSGNDADIELTSLSNQQSLSSHLDSTSSKVEQLLRNLVNKSMGDSEQAERMIQYEYRQSPALSKEEAVQAAIMRWESDNR